MSRYEELLRRYAGTRVGKAVGGGLVLGLGILIYFGQPALGVFVGAIGLIVLIWSLMSEPSEEKSEPEAQGVMEPSYQAYQQGAAQPAGGLSGQLGSPMRPAGQAQQYPMQPGQLPFSAPQAGIDYGQPQQSYVGQGNMFPQPGGASHQTGQPVNPQHYDHPQRGYGQQAPGYGQQAPGYGQFPVGAYPQQNSPYGQQ